MGKETRYEKKKALQWLVIYISALPVSSQWLQQSGGPDRLRELCMYACQVRYVYMYVCVMYVCMLSKVCMCVLCMYAC